MDTSELLKRVRRVEIKSRGLSDRIFSGQYHSAFKGRGMAFSENREYQPGDDVRAINWNVTARMGTPYMKVFEEERELTVMMLVDVSGSGRFGSGEQTKRDLMTEIAAVLSFSAIQNNDKIGVILFSDRVEKFIPPKKGKSHTLRIIRELLDFEPENKGTNINEALKFFNQVVKKRSIAFLMSDFMDDGFEDTMRIAKRKHDLVALRIYDNRETELPDVGMIRIRDAETGELKWFDSSTKDVRIKFKANNLRHEARLKEIFTKSGVDTAWIQTDRNYTIPLMNLFKRRESRF